MFILIERLIKWKKIKLIFPLSKIHSKFGKCEKVNILIWDTLTKIIINIFFGFGNDYDLKIINKIILLKKQSRENDYTPPIPFIHWYIAKIM